MAYSRNYWFQCWLSCARLHELAHDPAVSQIVPKIRPKIRPKIMPIDLIKRFAATPLHATLRVSGKLVAFQTNSRTLLDRLFAAPSVSAVEEMDPPDCSWRIFVEKPEDENLEAGTPICRQTGDGNLSFVTVGRHDFLAYDARTGRGISFLSESLVHHPSAFLRFVLPSLASLLPGTKPCQ